MISCDDVLQKIILTLLETDLCQWTEWTSCDFFCGTPRISQKTREKASEGSDGDCRKDLDTSVNIYKMWERKTVTPTNSAQVSIDLTWQR